MKLSEKKAQYKEAMELCEKVSNKLTADFTEVFGQMPFTVGTQDIWGACYCVGLKSLFTKKGIIIDFDQVDGFGSNYGAESFEVRVSGDSFTSEDADKFFSWGAFILGRADEIKRVIADMYASDDYKACVVLGKSIVAK